MLEVLLALYSAACTASPSYLSISGKMLQTPGGKAFDGCDNISRHDFWVGGSDGRWVGGGDSSASMIVMPKKSTYYRTQTFQFDLSAAVHMS